MARSIRATLVSLPLAALVACGPGAAEEGSREASVMGTSSGSALSVDDLRRTVEIAHEKFVSLAEAMPEETLGWRPMEGVRSVQDVYVHIAADNFYVPALLGIEAPSETGITSDYQTFSAYQQRSMTRAEMLDALDASFAFFLGAIDQTAGELDREVTLGTPTTVGDVWIRAVTHLHEHLGQGIAYARANRVVPPWSR